MRQVNIHEAKTNLSQLLAAVEAGEEIVLARKGKPIARLIREPDPQPILRTLGGWEGWSYNEEKWKEGDAEILADFEEALNKPIG